MGFTFWLVMAVSFCAIGHILFSSTCVKMMRVDAIANIAGMARIELFWYINAA